MTVHAVTTPLPSSSTPASATRPPAEITRAALKKVPVQPAYWAWPFSSRLAMYRPSQAMSWVDEQKATMASMAILAANQNGVCIDKATKPSATPPASSKMTTIFFLLLASSMKGLHSGLNTQANPISAVQRVIWSLAMPRLCSMTAASCITAKKGRPCARYRLGTQK